MGAFSYLALDNAGKEQKGVLEGDSSRQIRQLLRDQGLVPLRIDNTVKKADGSGSFLSLSQQPTLKVGELAMITRQIATLIQSGMPLEESLKAVSRQTESTKVRGIVMAVRSKVMEGHTLADSLMEFPKAFPALYRATVSAGEHAGHLDLVMNRLADYTESSHSSRQKAKLAMLYPMLLLVMSLSIVSGLMAFVVPDVVEVFIGQGQQLPMLTRALIAISDFVVDYGLLTLLIGVALVVAIRYALQQDAIRLIYHRQLLTWPMLGRLSRGSNSARYAGTLSILNSSGVPLVDAMKIASEVMGNLWLQQSLRTATQQVREGGSLHKALERCGNFPPMMVYMIASGEASGDLDNMLERVSETQQREFDNLIAAMIGIFEPVMLLVMGGSVLVIVIAILQPIFDLNSLI